MPRLTNAIGAATINKCFPPVKCPNKKCSNKSTNNHTYDPYANERIEDGMWRCLTCGEHTDG